MKSKQIRSTVILFSILLILSLAVLFIQKTVLQKPGTTAIVTQDGQVIWQLPLDEERQLLIEDENGGTNTLIVKDHTVCISEANCPDLVCVHTPAISHTGEVIACLPHHLIITVSNPEDTIDTAAW